MKHAHSYHFPMTRENLALLPMEQRIYFVEQLVEAEKLGLICNGDFYALGELDQRSIWAMVSPAIMAHVKDRADRRNFWEHGFPRGRKWFVLVWFCLQVAMFLTVIVGSPNEQRADYSVAFVLVMSVLTLLSLASFGAIILDLLMLTWAWVKNKAAS